MRTVRRVRRAEPALTVAIVDLQIVPGDDEVIDMVPVEIGHRGRPVGEVIDWERGRRRERAVPAPQQDRDAEIAGGDQATAMSSRPSWSKSPATMALTLLGVPNPPATVNCPRWSPRTILTAEP